MRTREMMALLEDASYPMKLVAAQSGVSYMKVFRYIRRDGKLTPDEKARLWRFAIMQPVVSEALNVEIGEEGE